MTMPENSSTLIIGPVAWGGVWGHGPELARHLSLSGTVEYLDPPCPPGPCAPSFRDGESYSLPEGVRLYRRRSRFRPGVMYGLAQEWANLRAAIASRAGNLITYYALGSVLALAWFRLSGRCSLYICADSPAILRNPLARVLFRTIGLRLTAGLATAGSLATSRLLYEDLGRVTRRRHYVPNGVRLEEIPSGISRKEPGAPFTAGFVGFFGEWVDLETVCSAARLLPEVRFVMVGDGPARERLERVDIPENIIFTGRLDRVEVFRQIASMDLCLAPFRINALTDRVSPVKLFEYWALGKPVLATHCRELELTAQKAPEALSFYTGPASLADAIRAFRDNQTKYDSASAQALRTVKEYDWAVLGEKIERLLR